MLTNFHTKYKVECKIGEGSFSEVLKCQERSTGKLVAAKQLKKHFKSINHASEIPELMVLKKISKHPNLLELYESYFDTSSGKVTLVFELMDMSLYDLMKTRKRPIPESRAKKYLYQIIKGIDHLHYHGIFHRDIKPENVLIKGEKVKISDMGSIKGFYSKQPYTEYISTRWYRSPECLLTKGFYGPKMDIWAIGCVYYELLTLKPLFPGSDELDQITKVNHVLGSPSTKLLNKLKKLKCRNLVPSFPHKKGSGLNSVIPMMTEEGREIFKQMIVYDPDSRINVRRLLEHKYFNEIRHEEMLSQRLLSTQSMPARSCRLTTSPMWLSFITATRKRRIKRKISTKTNTEKKHAVQKTQSNMSRVSTVVSSEVSYSNNSDDGENNSNNVYSMKPVFVKEEIEEEEHLPSDNIYSVQSDRIPGYEQFTKRRILQNLGTKALAGLAMMKNKDKKATVGSLNLASKYLQDNNETDVFQPDHKKYFDSEPMITERDRFQAISLNQPVNLQSLINDEEYTDLIDLATHKSYNNFKVNENLQRNDSHIREDNLNLKLMNIDKSAVSMELKSMNNVFPNDDNIRMQFNTSAYFKRLQNISEEAAVNLEKNPTGRTSSNTSRQQDFKLKRFYSGPTKKVPITKEINNFGPRKISTIGLKSSLTNAGSNLKSKQGTDNMVMLQRRMESVDVTGAPDSSIHFRTKH